MQLPEPADLTALPPDQQRIYIRRQRNRVNAAASRARRHEHYLQLQVENEELKAEVKNLKGIISLQSQEITTLVTQKLDSSDVFIQKTNSQLLDEQQDRPGSSSLPMNRSGSLGSGTLGLSTLHISTPPYFGKETGEEPASPSLERPYKRRSMRVKKVRFPNSPRNHQDVGKSFMFPKQHAGLPPVVPRPPKPNEHQGSDANVLDQTPFAEMLECNRGENAWQYGVEQSSSPPAYVEMSKGAETPSLAHAMDAFKSAGSMPSPSSPFKSFVDCSSPFAVERTGPISSETEFDQELERLLSAPAALDCFER